MCGAKGNVRFTPKADIRGHVQDVFGHRELHLAGAPSAVGPLATAVRV